MPNPRVPIGAKRKSTPVTDSEDDRIINIIIEYVDKLDSYLSVPGGDKFAMERRRPVAVRLLPVVEELARLASQRIEYQFEKDELRRTEMRLRLAELEGAIEAARSMYGVK